MSDCVFKFTGRQTGGKFIHRCSRCGREIPSRYENPALLRAQCASAPDPLARRTIPTYGPGTELSKLIKELQLKREKNCGCAQMAAQMNVWGIEGCQNNREAILEQLQKNYQKITYKEIRELIVIAWRHLRWLNIFHPLESMLDEAIRRASIPMPVYVNLDRIGWGDIAIFSYIANGTKDSTRPLVICATGERARHVRMLGLEPEEDVTKDKHEWEAFTKEMEYYHEGGTEGRLEFYSRFYNVPAKFEKPELTLPEEYIRWAKKTGIDRNTVLFFPDSLAPNRVWPKKYYWNDLGRLLKKAGLKSIAFPIGGFENYENSLDVRPVAKVAACMKLAGLAIGNDSALINWTPLVDLPSLVLLGPTPKYIFNHAPLIRPITPKTPLPYDGGEDCNGCCYHFKHNPFCSQTCMSLANLMPEEVAKAAIAYHKEFWK